MRLIDAIPLSEGIELHCQSTDQDCELDYCWAEGFNAGLDCALRCIAHAKTITPPSNAPLTLDELREMNGEPVWVEYGDAGKWVIASSDPIEILRRLGDTPYLLSLHSYAKGWVAYRRKPDEGTT